MAVRVRVRRNGCHANGPTCCGSLPPTRRPRRTAVVSRPLVVACGVALVKPGVSFRLPVLIIHRSADQVVSSVAGETFARKMIAAGYPVEFVSKVGADHGDVLVKGAPEMLAFLRQRFA